MRNPPAWATEVRAEMFSLGIKVKDLAEVMGYNPDYLSSLFTGNRKSRFSEKLIKDTLQKLKAEMPHANE